MKERLHALIELLTDSQIIYSFHFLSRLFGLDGKA